MKDFIFRLPTRVLFGEGSIEKIGEESKRFGGKKAFLVTGKTSTKNSPYFQVALASLEKAGFEIKVYSEVEADPSIETVDEGARQINEWEADIVIAFGGGSPMDAAKSMAILQTNEGSIADYIRKVKTIQRPGLPVVCIPTTAGTGSEVTAGAVTTDKKAKEKIGLTHDYLFPKLAIIDPQIHESMPPSVTAATGLDALTHAIEAYVATSAHPISDALCLYAIRMIGENLRRAVANGKDLEARGKMALASLIAGAGFANVGLGAVHGIAHPIGAQFGISHGVANALMLPYVMEYNLIGELSKFKEIAVALGEDVQGLTLRDAAKKSVEAVVKLKEDLGVPHTLKEVGIGKEAIPAIIKDAITYRLLPNNPRKPTETDFEMILKKALG